MPNYRHMTSGGLRTNTNVERKLIGEIQKQLQGSYIRRSGSGKYILTIDGKHTLALVDTGETYEDATFVYSMGSARNAAGVAANVKLRLSSLLQQMQDNEVEKS